MHNMNCRCNQWLWSSPRMGKATSWQPPSLWLLRRTFSPIDDAVFALTPQRAQTHAWGGAPTMLPYLTITQEILQLYFVQLGVKGYEEMSWWCLHSTYTLFFRFYLSEFHSSRDHLSFLHPRTFISSMSHNEMSSLNQPTLPHYCRE